jgi:hypothetical protein
MLFSAYYHLKFRPRRVWHGDKIPTLLASSENPKVWRSHIRIFDMDSVDAQMIDATDCSLISGHSIENLKHILEHRLIEINTSVSIGISEIKAELNDRMQTILIAIPRQPMQNGNPVSIRAGNSWLHITTAYWWTQVGTFIGTLRSGTGHVPEVLNGDPAHWKAQYERVEQEKEQLKVEFEKLRRDKEQEYRALEVRIGNIDQSSKNTQELQQRLATINQQNIELREQVSKFREIILKRTNNQVQAIPDSTLINSFVDLRVQIQHIVFKFYRFDRAHHLKLKGASSTQQDFFGLFARDFSEAQLKRRARARIFEILSQEILCRPIFGLDDFDKKGDLESSLCTFESTLNSITRGKQ